MVQNINKIRPHSGANKYASLLRYHDGTIREQRRFGEVWGLPQYTRKKRKTEEEGTAYLENVCNSQPVETACHPRRHKIPSTSLH